MICSRAADERDPRISGLIPLSATMVPKRSRYDDDGCESTCSIQGIAMVPVTARSCRALRRTVGSPASRRCAMIAASKGPGATDLPPCLLYTSDAADDLLCVDL